MITADTILNELESFVFNEVSPSYGEKLASACCTALIECLYLNFKDQLMYIPTSNRVEQAKKHQAIFNDFTGNNHKELAIKYRLSLPSIYKITNSQKNKYINKIQYNLFPLPEEINIKPVTLIVTQEYLPNEFILCGLSSLDSNKLANKVSDYLLIKYPGIAICISNKIRKEKIKKKQISLF